VDRQERAKIETMTKIVYDGPEGLVVNPLTEKSSCFWGRGTQWCTATSIADNYFHEYARRGPLYIIIPADGEKYQFHVESRQFVDSSDDEVNLNSFFDTYPWVFSKAIRIETKKICVLVKKNYAWAKALPSLKDDEMVTLLTEAPKAAMHMSQHISDNVVRQVVKLRLDIMSYLTNVSDDIIIETIDHSPDVIQLIKQPKNEWVKRALRHNPALIGGIPDVTESLMRFAFKLDPKVISRVQYIPTKLQMELVEDNPANILLMRNAAFKVQQYALEQNPALYHSITQQSSQQLDRAYYRLMKEHRRNQKGK